jgi:hypothetical protein
MPEVEGMHLLYFRSPFFAEAECVRDCAKMEWPASPFRTQSLKKEFRRMANIPERRRFSLRRSCLSCRTLFISHALRYMERIGADFIVTGELVGRNGLDEDDLIRVMRNAGATGQVLRPLSARLLPPTPMENSGAIPRKALSGLVADDQDGLLDLASSLGIAADAALDCYKRCRLTAPGYGARLENLLREERFTLNALRLLDFRLYYKQDPDVKFVLATDEEEKRALQNLLLPQDLRVYLPTHRGPMCLVRTDWTSKEHDEVREIIDFACRVTATHSEASDLASVLVCHRFENHDETSQSSVSPFSAVEEIARYCFASETFTSLV